MKSGWLVVLVTDNMVIEHQIFDDETKAFDSFIEAIQDLGVEPSEDTITDNVFKGEDTTVQLLQLQV